MFTCEHTWSDVFFVFLFLFLGTEVTKQETTRSGMENAEEERYITVQDTAISRVTCDDKAFIDVQGKRILIRKSTSEDAGVHTHGQ